MGHGGTPLSAFDAALKSAGIYNYNLIVLSSIIPPNSKIINKTFESKIEEYGYRLYLVKAEMRSRESGKYIGAALGWYQLEDGRGVFVEHEEIEETRDAVKSNLSADIKKSLTDLCRFRGYPINERKMKIKMSIAKIKDSPTCVMVVAVYKAESWE